MTFENNYQKDLKILPIPQRVILTELEFLQSVFSVNTILQEKDEVIKFIINNCKEDELKFEEWRINFGYTMKELPAPHHAEGVSTYWVRKKDEN